MNKGRKEKKRKKKPSMDQWALIPLVTVMIMNALLMSLKLEERM
jgi:hypothetical protein